MKTTEQTTPLNKEKRDQSERKKSDQDPVAATPEGPTKKGPNQDPNNAKESIANLDRYHIYRTIHT